MALRLFSLCFLSFFFCAAAPAKAHASESVQTQKNTSLVAVAQACAKAVRGDVLTPLPFLTEPLLVPTENETSQRLEPHGFEIPTAFYVFIHSGLSPPPLA